ncbi:MAG: LCP family protein [Armatimonadetes bacterium]|nr:LCP family protein [Armatimonadota bacterium]
MAETGKPETAKKSRGKQVLQWSLYGLYIFAFLVVGTAIGFIGKSGVLGEMVDLFLDPEDPADVFGQPALNLLILGTDEDRLPGGEQVSRSSARSDLVMVARLNFEGNRITGLTIPRDTLAEIPGRGVRRINAAHAFGGPSLAQATVEKLTGVRIDRVVVVNYTVFQEMVDLLGGIDVDVKNRLKYDDASGDLHIDLYPGQQRLDGYDAMGYVRYRGDGDFRRQGRQRSFLIAFKDRAKQRWTKLPELVERTRELTGNVFDDRELASLFLFSRRVGSQNIKLGMLPVLEGENYDLMVDTEKLYQTLKEYELIRT